MSNLIAFGYYGGKYSHLDWLLPLLPVNGITHYIEPFGGSAAVILNRPPVHIETYNDIDGEVVNFFRVLREKRMELMELLAFTPFSRTEYEDCLTYSTDMSSLERARRFYVRARQTMMSLVQDASPGRWAYVVGTEGGSGVTRWFNGIPKLQIVAERLASIQIENLPALELIGRYDHENALIYCDPPYVLDTRNGGKVYHTEMTDDEHRQLADTLQHCLAKVAISGYKNALYDELYAGWYCTEGDIKSSFASSHRSTRQEVLWTNYDPAKIHSVEDLPLFQVKAG